MSTACGSETRDPEEPVPATAPEAPRVDRVERRPEEPCDVALAEEEARHEALAEEVEGAPPFDREGYLERCRAASIAAQRCMSRRYAESHAEECAPPAFPSDPEGAPS